ncbi:hypothetical protein PSN45_005282 [Yamadazyma tenuis]|nr:hypothetical protein PSN45_005282 [Yamadazyma tenuis]
MVSFADKAIKFNQLGSSNGIVNQLKATEYEPSMSEDLKVAQSKVRTSTFTSSSESSVPTKFVLSSARNFVQEFLNFKQQQVLSQAVKDPNPKLETSFISYEGSLNDPENLKEFTNRVVQESQAGRQFSDYSFRRFGDQPVSKVKKLNFDPQFEMPDLVDYLVKYEGFKRQDLACFIETELDYGLEEIERELNKIKDNQREREKNINIGGETSDAAHTHKGHTFIYLLAVIFAVSIYN